MEVSLLQLVAMTDCGLAKEPYGLLILPRKRHLCSMFEVCCSG